MQYEFKEIKAAIEFNRTVTDNVGWKSLITTPGNRKRMNIIIAIAFFSQWSGNGLVSYYLNKVFDQIGITGTGTQLLINGILQIWNLAWAMSAAFMVERLGRRFLFLLSAALMTLFYTAQAICFSQYAQHETTAAGHAVIAFIFLFYAAYDIAFTPLIVSYTLEILPFHLRAKGFNIFSFVISVALIFNQYVNPIALDALGWKYYVSRARCPLMTDHRTYSRVTDLARVCLLARFRICFLVVLPHRDQGSDVRGDSGAVRWRGCPRKDHTTGRGSRRARGFPDRKAECMMCMIPTSSSLTYAPLSSPPFTFRLAGYLCIFFLLRIFVTYYCRPLVSSYLPLAMSLNIHLCTIHRKKPGSVRHSLKHNA